MALFDDLDYSPIDSPGTSPAVSAEPQPAGLGLAQSSNGRREVDWKDMLAATIEGAASGYLGKPSQVPGLLMRRHELADRKELQAQQIQLEKMKSVPHLLESLTKVSSMVSDPELAKQVGEVYAPLFKEVGGVEYPPDFFSNLILDPGKGDVLKQLYPELESLPPKQLLQIAKNPAQLDKLVEKKRGQLGEEGFKAAIDLRKADGIKEDVTLAQLNELLPQTKYLTDDQKLQLNQAGYKNITSKGVMEAQLKDEPQQQRFEEREKRQREENIAREDRMERNQTRLAGQNAAQLSLQERRAAQTDERIRLSEEQQRRLLPSQVKTLTQNRTAMKAIDDFSGAYEEFVKESGGGVASDMFRGAIAKNATAQRVADLVTVKGRTPAEIKLAAKYNTIVGNLRSITDEVGVLTDTDAGRILRSFDVSVGREQVRANLSERGASHRRTIDTALEDYQAMGKDVSGFLNRRSTDSPTGVRPRVQNPDGSFSSERSMTFEVDGQFVNVPTMYGGKDVSPEQAIKTAQQNKFVDVETGRKLPFYKTKAEALKAAKERTEQLGRNMPAQSEIEAAKKRLGIK